MIQESARIPKSKIYQVMCFSFCWHHYTFNAAWPSTVPDICQERNRNQWSYSIKSFRFIAALQPSLSLTLQPRCSGLRQSMRDKDISCTFFQSYSKVNTKLQAWQFVHFYLAWREVVQKLPVLFLLISTNDHLPSLQHTSSLLLRKRVKNQIHWIDDC